MKKLFSVLAIVLMAPSLSLGQSDILSLPLEFTGTGISKFYSTIYQFKHDSIVYVNPKNGQEVYSADIVMRVAIVDSFRFSGFIYSIWSNDRVASHKPLDEKWIKETISKIINPDDLYQRECVTKLEYNKFYLFLATWDKAELPYEKPEYGLKVKVTAEKAMPDKYAYFKKNIVNLFGFVFAVIMLLIVTVGAFCYYYAREHAHRSILLFRDRCDRVEDKKSSLGEYYENQKRLYRALAVNYTKLLKALKSVAVSSSLLLILTSYLLFF